MRSRPLARCNWIVPVGASAGTDAGVDIVVDAAGGSEIFTGSNSVDGAVCGPAPNCPR